MRRGLLVSALFLLMFSCVEPDPTVVIETELGNIILELYTDKAPLTTANFLRYINENRYQGATFYRVVTLENQPYSSTKIEVIQGGLFEDNPPLALPPIPHESTEQTGVLHLDGVISMARYEPGTATFEFFICVGDQPSLDAGGFRNPDQQGFAAFGQVVAGMEVVRKIHQQPEQEQFLQTRIKIQKIRVID